MTRLRHDASGDLASNGIGHWTLHRICFFLSFFHSRNVFQHSFNPKNSYVQPIDHHQPKQISLESPKSTSYGTKKAFSNVCNHITKSKEQSASAAAYIYALAYIFSSSSSRKTVVLPSSARPARQRASVPSIEDLQTGPTQGYRGQAFPARHPPAGCQ